MAKTTIYMATQTNLTSVKNSNMKMKSLGLHKKDGMKFYVSILEHQL